MNYNLLDKEWSAALTQRHSVTLAGEQKKQLISVVFRIISKKVI